MSINLILDGIEGILPSIEQKTELTKEMLCQKLTEVITPALDDELNCELFISNYIYITQRTMNDIGEINARLSRLRQLDQSIPSERDYVHKKLRHFAEINRRAKDEIIDFISGGLVEFLVEHKSVNYLASRDDELSNLRLASCYKYGFYKRYYDADYDFSTEAKIRFIPGIRIDNYLDVIKQYIDLKKTDYSAYKVEIARMITENNVLEHLCSQIEVHNLMCRRVEIFDTLKYLYDAEKWQSFVALAILQIEGLFFDCCNALKLNDLSKTAGTFSEKVEKSFRDNDIIMMSVYPYYNFDVPDIRNEIAHTGFYRSDDLKHLANELILDLNTVISWIYDITHEKYTVLKMIGDKLDEEPQAGAEKKAMTLVCEMLSCTSIADYKYLDLLKCPTDFSEEMQCMKTPDGYWDAIINKIMAIIKTEEFWIYIDNNISETDVYEQNKPYNFVALADKLKNTFIPVLMANSPEKKACQRVAAKVQRCKKGIDNLKECTTK